MARYYIVYQDIAWPVAEVTIFPDTPEQKEVLVATTELEERILNDNTERGRQLDETIAYYVRPNEIELPYEDIIKIVEDSYN